MEPTITPAVLALLGDNYLGHALRSPGDPRGAKIPNQGERALVALNSVLSNFLPLYTKAQTVAQGGASAFDTSTLVGGIQTKGPNPGVGQGLLKAIQPLREYAKPAAKTTTRTKTSGWGPVSTPSASGGGWGPASSTSKTSGKGGWGP